MNQTLPLSDFYERLALDGRAVVLDWHEPTPEDLRNTVIQLTRADLLARQSAPGMPPALDTSAALWAVKTLFWACGVFVNRAQSDTSLPKSLGQTEPRGDTACHHWSVDLGLRFLPSLIERSEKVASDDTLLRTLRELATRWPLSSASAKFRENNVLKWNPLALATLLSDDALRHLLADRVLIHRNAALAEQSGLLDDENFRYQWQQLG